MSNLRNTYVALSILGVKGHITHRKKVTRVPANWLDLSAHPNN